MKKQYGADAAFSGIDDGHPVPEPPVKAHHRLVDGLQPAAVRHSRTRQRSLRAPDGAGASQGAFNLKALLGRGAQEPWRDGARL